MAAGEGRGVARRIPSQPPHRRFSNHQSDAVPTDTWPLSFSHVRFPRAVPPPAGLGPSRCPDGHARRVPHRTPSKRKDHPGARNAARPPLLQPRPSALPVRRQGGPRGLCCRTPARGHHRRDPARAGAAARDQALRRPGSPSWTFRPYRLSQSSPGSHGHGVLGRAHGDRSSHATFRGREGASARALSCRPSGGSDHSGLACWRPVG